MTSFDSNYFSQNANLPLWLEAIKRAHADAFLKKGLPTRKHERFKYMDLSELTQYLFRDPIKIKTVSSSLKQAVKNYQTQEIVLVCINGRYCPALSLLDALPNTWTVCTIQDALQNHANVLQEELQAIDANQHPFANLNMAKFEDGLFILVPDNSTYEPPIHLLFVSDQTEPAAHFSRHIVRVGQHSRLTILEEYWDAPLTNHFTNNALSIAMGQSSKLEHCKIRNANQSFAQMGFTHIKQSRDSEVTSHQFILEGKFYRDDIQIDLNEPGAVCSLGGFYFLKQDQQYLDVHINMNHLAPKTHSHMLYKGLLKNKSRGVFDGHVYVKKGSEKIKSYQANRNVLLTKHAEMNAKPQLEIYADDVICRHGAAIGYLDNEALFYLRSRGLSDTDAMQLLLQGFLKEVVDLISHPQLKNVVEQRLTTL